MGVLEEAGGVGRPRSNCRVGYLVSYAAKSATEKISRNRHGLDADGNPIGGAGAGEYTTTTTSDKEAKG